MEGAGSSTGGGFQTQVIAGVEEVSLHGDGGRFCISVLDDSSMMLLKHFAPGFEPGQPAFEGVETALDDAGVPYLSDALSWFSCRVVGEAAGWTDHVLFCGAVEAGARRDDAPPMVHVRRNGLSY